ncbi:MAG: porin family protein [Saprospiraceae bacterium]
MNTAKRIITTTFALLLVTLTFAQVSLGLKGGVNFANITLPEIGIINIPDAQTNKSFTVGAVAEFGIKNGFAIQTEANYTKKGFIINEGIPLELANIPLPVGVKVTTDLNYIEVPILAKYNFGNGKVGGYVTAGPTMSYASGGRFRTAANFIIDFNVIDRKFDFDDLNISKFDIGASIGAGGTVNLGATKLFVDARYTHGFNKLDNIPVIDLDFKNKNFALTTGFLIPLNKGYSRPRA